MFLYNCFKVFTIFFLYNLVIRSTCKSLNFTAPIYYGVTETKPETINQALLNVLSTDLFTDNPVVILYKSYEEDDGTEYDNTSNDEEPELQIEAQRLVIPNGNKSLYEKTEKVLESPINNNGDMETANTIFLPFLSGPRPGSTRKGCRFRKRRGRKFGGGWQICDYDA